MNKSFSDPCFFCNTEKNGRWLYSFEFDTFFHIECLLEKLLEGSAEAIIIARENKFALMEDQ